MTLYHPPQDLLRFFIGKSEFSFFPSGDVHAFTHDGLLLSGFRGSASAGSVNQIYLRRLGGETGTLCAPLLGLAAGGRVTAGADCLRQEGQALGVFYEVLFHAVEEGLWTWQVRLWGMGRFDLIYGQDLGLADQGAVLTNELYAAQYLGHTILEGPLGPVIASRQNLPQGGGRCPCLQQGMLRGEAAAYCTDGTQFFGLAYKKTDRPQALESGLPGAVYQYEFAYTGLQSQAFDLVGEADFAFYALLTPDHPGAVRGLEGQDRLAGAEALLESAPAALRELPPMARHPDFGPPYASPALTPGQIEARWPRQRLQEWQGEQLLSFFTEDHTHVVLQEKELQCQRPHGTILMNAVPAEGPREDTLAATCYMYGLFGAQIVTGNTNLHKAVSAARGMLNVQKQGGIRLYLLLEGRYRLLTLPAAFAMTAGSATWIYPLPEGDVLRVTAQVAAQSPLWSLRVESESGRAYAFLLTAQLVMGDQEWSGEIEMERRGDTLRTRPGPGQRALSPYPGLHFDWRLEGAAHTLGDDGMFFADGAGRDQTLLTYQIEATPGFSLLVRGGLEEAEEAEETPLTAPPAPQESALAFQASFAGHLRGLRLLSGDPGMARLSETLPWYLHNALIHYASPHGLEQPGGAAWGTRDVCQGPFEWMLAFGHFALARRTLLRIFAHQGREDGLWPQWFMFDRYDIAAGECHGDVFLWPLKITADYLRATGDRAVLSEPLPYAGAGEEESLLHHLRRAVLHFRQRFLPGTALLSYAGGDWDDTLQPVDPDMQRNLVSSWTQALGVQVARSLGRTLEEAAPELSVELLALAGAMAAAFERYLVIDGQIAGFVLRQGEAFLPLLHPRDTLTGLRCRLIPLTRSVLAELVDDGQAGRNLEQIEGYLACPDGVRLMDHPAPYDGGVAHLFRRAEQAANVGREISLQYVHAHIRYVEALAKLGKAGQALEALLKVIPPDLRESVGNAAPRQSNLYFSSSDGDYPDRYAYARDYALLRTGDIPVKGGWRLYSSGPGIALHTLVTHVLGIGLQGGTLVLDPVLPVRLDGLRVEMECFGRVWTFHYHLSPGPVGLVRVEQEGRPVAGEQLSSRYRPAGWRMDKETLLALPGGTLEIYAGGGEEENP